MNMGMHEMRIMVHVTSLCQHVRVCVCIVNYIES